MLFTRSLIALTLAALLLIPQELLAQEHVVSPADLHNEMQAAAQARQKNVATIEKAFSAEPVKKALQTAKIDYSKVEKAIPLLTDEELARLASQAEKIQNDFAAGALSNQELTYIIIALATAVVILIIVKAR